jgi:hypothetical protein
MAGILLRRYKIELNISDVSPGVSAGLFFVRGTYSVLNWKEANQ